jgi:TetR/AcrR family transcriptional regulator, transcriptional repressor for nem operon
MIHIIQIWMICIICPMRHSRDEKAKSHERIVEVASERIRAQGTGAPGVAEIMEAAGLTHGGFYKHFGSRDELIAEATERTLAENRRAVGAMTEGLEDPLGAYVDWYTSNAHRDEPATGCGVAALGADVSRCDARVRQAYTDHIRGYLAQLETLIGDGPDARRRATVALSSLVGAVIVARAVDDEQLSAEILRSVADSVKALAG